MEKVIAALWAPDGESRTEFGERLVKTLPAALQAAGANGIRLNVRDATVAPAAALNQIWQTPQQDAIAQFWLPSANPIFRQPVDAVLHAHCTRFHAWLVTEATILPNLAHRRRPERGPGAGRRQVSFPSGQT